MTESTVQEFKEWPVIQTDAGPVAMAPVEELKARATQWQAWAANAAATAQSLRNQSEEKLGAAGSILVARNTEWQVPADLQGAIRQAIPLSDRIADDDRRFAALKGEESSAGAIGRFGIHHHEHESERDRTEAARKLRVLLLPIARSAPANTIAEADSLRREASELETQAGALDAQIKAAQASADVCSAEVVRRQAAIKAMGFDSLYETASLQTSGAQPVDSPLVLKSGELAYLSAPATLARMVTRTHYVGGSTGLSFPIAHTGIRYRVGAFRDEPVHQQSMTRLDTGTFVVTNQRVAYVGRAKSANINLNKVMHVEVYNDGLSIAVEGRENSDFFLMANPKLAVFILNWVLSKQAAK